MRVYKQIIISIIMLINNVALEILHRRNVPCVVEPGKMRENIDNGLVNKAKIEMNEREMKRHRRFN